MKRLLSMFVSVLFFSAASAAEPDAAKDDLRKLQGTWVVVHFVLNGRTVMEQDTSYTVEIEGEKLSFGHEMRMGAERKGTTQDFTLRLDPAKSPKQMDLVAHQGIFKDKTFPAIYEFEGEMLKLCRTHPGRERPADFSCKEGSQHWLLLMKKTK